MKKIIIAIVLISGMMFTSCSNKNQNVENDAAISDELQQEFTVKENEEIKPLFEKGRR